MRCVQVISALALRRLLNSIAQPVGAGGVGPGMPDLLGETDQHMARALRQASVRAWTAVEILLGGETLWEQAQLVWERELENDFYKPLRRLLDKADLGPHTDADQDRKAWRALEAALSSGLLTSGALEPVELLAGSPETDSPEDARQAEWDALERTSQDLANAGYGELRGLFFYRWKEEPLLVLTAAALFLRAIQSDPDLFGSFADVCTAELAADSALAEFHDLAAFLDKHRSRLSGLLNGLRPKEETRPVAPVPVDTAGGANRLQRGQACAQRGEYEQAIGEFTAAVSLDPASAQAFLRRADAHRLRGDHVQALVDYSTALKLDPCNAGALLNRGQVQLMMQQTREAIDDFTAALQIDARNAAAYHFRGKAYLAAGEVDNAISNFNEALRLDPYHAWAHHDCGDAFAEKNNFELAITAYSEAIRLNPLATLSYLRRAETYARMGQDDRAIADYGNAVRLDPHNVAAFLGRGVAQRRRGLLDQAAADLARALELDISSPVVYFERGLLFSLQANHERAVRDFDAALRLDAKNAEIYYRRALALRDLGNDDRAIEDLSQAVRLEPQHAAAFHERGLLYALRGDQELAMADFTMALEVEPSFAEAYVSRARALFKRKNLDEAVADCERALQHDSQLASAYLVRGSVQAQRGKLAEAVDDLSHVMRLGEATPQVYFLRGYTNARVGNPNQALADLTEAIRMDPRYARAYAQRAAIRKDVGQNEHALDDLAHAARLDRTMVPAYCGQLGLVHASQGNYERAVADYTIALMLDPGNPTLQAARKRAWKMYLNPPRPKAAAPLPQPEPLHGVPAAPLENTTPESADQDAKKTSIHLKAAETAIDVPVVYDDAGTPHLDKTPVPVPKADATEDSTEFTFDVAPTPAKAKAAEAPPAAEETAAEGHPSTWLEDGITVDEESVDEEFDDSAALEFAETDDERIQREANEGRTRLAEEWRRAEEERKKAEASKKATEEKEEKKAKKKKKQEDEDDDDDDDGGLALWKKGVIVAATLVLLWWTGSGAMAWYLSPVRTMQPRVTVSGTAVLASTNEPLAGTWVSFYPKEGGGDTTGGFVTKSGKFSASVFPGTYTVTVGPDPESGSTKLGPKLKALPTIYKDPKTSPLTAEVSANSTSFEFKLK